MIRILFFFPRFTFRTLIASTEVFSEEVIENFSLFLKLVKVQKLRRSSRKRNIPKAMSPSRKRKHEEVSTDTLPHYFKVETYNENEDSDYVPPSDDDTEVTSASERSGLSEEDENEEVEIKEVKVTSCIRNKKALPISDNQPAEKTEMSETSPREDDKLFSPKIDRQVSPTKIQVDKLISPRFDRHVSPMIVLNKDMAVETIQMRRAMETCPM